MQIETWKWIPDYEGRYQVSNHGRVKSFLFSKEGKLVKPDIVGNGYARVHLQFGRTFLVHRIVAQAFIPNTLDAPTVNHKDGIKTNNYVENLEWSTYSDNMKHSWRNLDSYRNRKVSLPRGEDSASAKLTSAKVREIRAIYAIGNTSQQKLAIIYGVSKPAIRCVLKRKTWAHVL